MPKQGRKIGTNTEKYQPQAERSIGREKSLPVYDSGVNLGLGKAD
jgi:hypothetical protein